MSKKKYYQKKSIKKVLVKHLISSKKRYEYDNQLSITEDLNEIIVIDEIIL